MNAKNCDLCWLIAILVVAVALWVGGAIISFVMAG